MNNNRNVLLFIFAFAPVVVIAQGLHIRNCNLILTGSIKLVLNNSNFINQGNFISGNSSTVIFTGNTSQIIGGSNPVSFQNITIEKTGGGDVQLNTDVAVQGTLKFISGNFNVNNRTLTLGDHATMIGESSGASVTGLGDGKITLVRNITTPANKINPGNIGIEITTQNAPGLTRFERMHKREVLANGKLGISRSFKIVPAYNKGMKATVKFYYADGELGTNTEKDLVMWLQSEGSNSWVTISRDGSDMQANWVVKTNLPQLARYTLGSQSILNKPVMSAAQIYPNPATDNFTIEITSAEETDIVLNLYDLSGRLLQQKKTICRAGVNQIKWSFGNFAPGIYHVTADNPGIKKLFIIKAK